MTNRTYRTITTREEVAALKPGSVFYDAAGLRYEVFTRPDGALVFAHQARTYEVDAVKPPVRVAWEPGVRG